MVRTYVYEKARNFILDLDSDRFESFKISEQYFRDNFKIKLIDYYPGGWDISYLKFEIDGIYMELIYRDFGGTEISINENLSDEEISKVTKWCEDICKIIEEKKEK